MEKPEISVDGGQKLSVFVTMRSYKDLKPSKEPFGYAGIGYFASDAVYFHL